MFPQDRSFKPWKGNVAPLVTLIRTLGSINDLAGLLQDQGKLSEAESLYREAVSGAKKTLGYAHPATVTFQENLDSVLQEMGKI